MAVSEFAWERQVTQLGVDDAARGLWARLSTATAQHGVSRGGGSGDGGAARSAAQIGFFFFTGGDARDRADSASVQRDALPGDYYAVLLPLAAALSMLQNKDVADMGDNDGWATAVGSMRTHTLDDLEGQLCASSNENDSVLVTLLRFIAEELMVQSHPTIQIPRCESSRDVFGGGAAFAASAGTSCPLLALHTLSFWRCLSLNSSHRAYVCTVWNHSQLLILFLRHSPTHSSLAASFGEGTSINSDLSAESSRMEVKDGHSALFDVTDSRQASASSSLSGGPSPVRFHVVEDAACVNEGLVRWNSLQVRPRPTKYKPCFFGFIFLSSEPSLSLSCSWCCISLSRFTFSNVLVA